MPISKKDNKTDCSNYRGISLLSTTYKILSNILLSRLAPYAEEITGYHEYGFQCNRSTTDDKFCTSQTLEKKWGYNEAKHQLFIDSKKLMLQLGETSCTIFTLSLVSHEIVMANKNVSE